MSPNVTPIVMFLFSQIIILLIARMWVRSIDNQLSNLAKGNSSIFDSLIESDEVVAILAHTKLRRKAIYIFIIFLVGIFFVITLYASLASPSEPEDQAFERGLEFGVIVSVSGVGPWIMLIYVVGHFRVVTKKGIMNRAPILKPFYAEWDQIAMVKWSPAVNQLYITTEKGKIIVAPEFSDLDKFAETIMTSLPDSKWKQARRMLISLRKRESRRSES